MLEKRRDDFMYFLKNVYVNATKDAIEIRLGSLLISFIAPKWGRLNYKK